MGVIMRPKLLIVKIGLTKRIIMTHGNAIRRVCVKKFGKFVNEISLPKIIVRCQHKIFSFGLVYNKTEIFNCPNIIFLPKIFNSAVNQRIFFQNIASLILGSVIRNYYLKILISLCENRLERSPKK